MPDEDEKWQPEDSAEAEAFAALEERVTAQTARIAELEKKWGELDGRAAAQADRAGELEAELARVEEIAARAEGARRATSTELTRAERRTERAKQRVAELEEETARIGELRERLAERDAAQADADRSRQEIAVLVAARERLEGAVEDAEARVAVAEEALAVASDRLTSQEAEKRALVADLVRTQSTLQARSEQLQGIMRSRWFRVARSAWRVRRRRPPTMAVLLALVSIAGAVITVIAAGNLGTAVAGLLGSAMLAVAALAYAIVVPGLRDRRVPRMAGEASFAQSLDGAETTGGSNGVAAETHRG